MTKVSKALILTLLISGGGYTAWAATTSPSEITGPVCIQDPATFKMNTNPNIWCEGGKVVRLEGLTGPSAATSDGKQAIAALSRLIGGKPLRCEMDESDQPIVNARCFNAGGEDVAARLRADGYLR